jgi:hypothetical protein
VPAKRYQTPKGTPLAVEATIQAVAEHQWCRNGALGIIFQGNRFGYGDLFGTDDAELTDESRHIFIPFTPGTVWHTYRVEVRGNVYSLQIDDRVMGQMEQSNTANASVGLYAWGYEINVRTFRVLPL